MTLLSDNCQRVYAPGIGCVEASLYHNGMLVGNETYSDGELISTNMFYNNTTQIPELNKITSPWDGAVLSEYTDEYRAQNPNSFDTWEGELLREDDENHIFSWYIGQASSEEAGKLLSLRNADFTLFIEIMQGLTKPVEKVFVYQNHSPREPWRRKRKR